MATVETVKAKLQSLIAGCQAATGDGSNDLTAQLAILTGLTAYASDGSTPTLETVETKLRNLLAVCQAKTGDGSANLTAQVKALIDTFSTTEIATMYSYNGTILPALPEWDKETYPYACIGMWGTLYCSKTSGITSLNAPFLKFTLLSESTIIFDEVKDIRWGDCEIVETDGNISIPIWANHDLANITASEPVPIHLPLTLYDGEITLQQADYMDNASGSISLEFGFADGDILEITLDGHTETYTARRVDTYNGILVGNNGLNGNDVDGVDDGGDILLTYPRFVTGWNSYIYIRTPGTHSVKIRLVEVK